MSSSARQASSSFLSTDAHFDHVFLCFVLEHLAEPAAALKAVQPVLRREGSITVIEGDHGSWFCYPQTVEALRAVECLIEVQARLGGDSLIGRRLHPLLVEAGFRDVRVSPRTGALARAYRSRNLGQRNCRPAPCHEAKRDLLLHVFQSCRRAVMRSGERFSQTNLLFFRRYLRADDSHVPSSFTRYWFRAC